MHKLPSNRKTALSEGHPFYMTGIPCKRGHIVRRYASGACVECNRAQSLDWQKNRKPAAYANNKKWRDKNRIELYGKSRAWALANSKRIVSYNMKRRATALRARPPWLSKAQIHDIRKIYETCPVGFHVDHIVPLKNRFVCGLDVAWNLQHLPASENSKKRNKFVS